ncbi:septal ring lytic transglycosylase RlpA family protein [Alteromonas facilis]|uniref:septal ring lytic transglycosylase RlpA family protein n=1 Tax=Alteromonas facilis TaxID=2048004 RepID=UPI000C282B20|nr:septal ring lytic transglycosylase RlpA family protein [Alteromonas facilis]
MKKILTTLVYITTLSLTFGCQYGGRYSQRHDSAPTYVPHSIARESAIPHYEPYREWNSRPYTVLGKRYYPLQTGKGFTEQGQASWYGQKFHGHLTSNGEIYDMYGMTAAHKTLPLPSFVRVTNKANGKQVVVRVNDRGPFHGDRIIDLSFAAAKKLDFLKTGTANVSLEVIHFDEQNRVTVGNGPTVSYAEYAGIEVPTQPSQTVEERDTTVADGLYIQVAALSDATKIQQISDDLSRRFQVPTITLNQERIYRLRLGPISNQHLADLLLDELRTSGFPEAFSISAQ